MKPATAIVPLATLVAWGLMIGSSVAAEHPSWCRESTDPDVHVEASISLDVAVALGLPLSFDDQGNFAGAFNAGNRWCRADDYIIQLYAMNGLISTPIPDQESAVPASLPTWCNHANTPSRDRAGRRFCTSDDYVDGFLRYVSTRPVATTAARTFAPPPPPPTWSETLKRSLRRTAQAMRELPPPPPLPPGPITCTSVPIGTSVQTTCY